ncbi:MAG: YqgE/AlgH family protein [Hasllibacter sp.]
MPDNLTGNLLVALPSMRDPRFRRAVVLICEHGEEGAMGLIVNKPAVDVAFEEIAEQLEIPMGPGGGARIHVGGPVETERGFLLHAGPPRRGGQAVTSDLSMCATVDLLKAVADGRGPSPCLMMLGYAGWGAGQLEDELAENGWLTAPATAELVFAGDPDAIWSRVLLTLGATPGALSGVGGQA